MGRQSILTETRNFIKLYEYSFGESEVPRDFIIWSGLSLIAAAVGDRAFYYKLGKPIFPNLYILLLGPSGLGKGTVCGRVSGFIDNDFLRPIVNYYDGKITSAYLHSFLDAERVRGQYNREVHGAFVRDARMYLIAEELGFSVGTGTLANDFIKFMTAYFTKGPGTYYEGTRTSGEHKIENPCFNWLAGSTPEWMLESIPPEAISGGFFARVIVVNSNYDWNKRVHRPTPPWDIKEVNEHLMQRVQYYATHAVGEFKYDYSAEELDRNWYEQRDAPTDMRLAPIWQREHDIMIKVSMLCALADMLMWEEPQLVISARHILTAQRLINSVRDGIQSVINLASVTSDTKYLVHVRQVIERAGEIQHSPLLRRLTSYGVNADILGKMTKTLFETGEIDIYRKTGKQAIWYKWKRRRVPSTLEVFSE